MFKVIRKILKIVALLLLVVFIAATIFLVTFDINSYRETIARKVSAAIGRSVTIGEIKLKISAIPTIMLRDINIAGAPWSANKKPLLRVDSMNVSFAFMPLFDGDFQVTEFNVDQASAHLEKKGDLNNWTFGDTAAKTSVSAPSAAKSTMPGVPKTPTFMADSIQLKSFNLIYEDGQTTQAVLLSNVSLQNLKTFSGNVLHAGRKYQLNGTVDNVMNLVAGKPNYGFNLKADAFSSSAAVSGKIGDTREFKNIYATVQLSGNDINAPLNAFGVKLALPKEPFKSSFALRGDLTKIAIENGLFTIRDGKSLKATLSGQIDRTAGKIKLELINDFLVASDEFSRAFGIRPFKLAFNLNMVGSDIVLNQISFMAGKTDFDGMLGVSLASKKPSVKGVLKSDYFDLNDIVTAKVPAASVASVGGKQEKPVKIFPSDSLDLSGLVIADVSATVSVNNIAVSGLDDRMSASAKADLANGVLKLSSVNIGLMKGNITGSAMLDSVQKEPIISANFVLNGLQLSELKALQSQIKDVAVNGVVNLNTSGKSVSRMMANMNGEIVLQTMSGTIISKAFNALPLPAMIIKNRVSPVSFSTSDQVSKILCGVVRVPLKDGIADMNNTVVLETDTVNFIASGKIDLKNETLSMSMVPSASTLVGKTANQALTLSQAVKIAGPFTDLKPELDTRSITETATQLGLNKLLKEKTAYVIPEKYKMCEKALGKPIKKPASIKTEAASLTQAKQAVAKPAVAKPAEQTPPVSAKEQFKQELFKSLAGALANK